MKITYTYWRETDGMFLGYLNEFRDHWTQGVDLEELKENLADLYRTFTSEEIPGIKRDQCCRGQRPLTPTLIYGCFRTD
ncbi:type II toxin-antitoxin system HicB family antitoxin [Crocosphaera sp.]|uniref:type II toxin-antitoxin system HicB family antitoxin n=1 Tax=Crocosphaera sp. TaxID=2729996 RepID=UPI003F5A1D42